MMMMMMMKASTTTILVAALLLARTGAFIIPGAPPHSYAEGDEILGSGRYTSSLPYLLITYYLNDSPFAWLMRCLIDRVSLKVNRMTSTRTLLPLDYYDLPFCTPQGGQKLDKQNLGENLAGDRIQSSPYYLQMKTDMYCEQLCVSNLGRSRTNKLAKAIQKNYHNNWLVDYLPAVSKHEDASTITTTYFGGFPIGYMSWKQAF
eukprot:scaffold49991_cov60-Attheya_sp.AAC.1